MKLRKLEKSDFYVGQDVFLLPMKRCYILRKLSDDTLVARVECVGKKYISVETKAGATFRFHIQKNFEQVDVGEVEYKLFIDETDIYDWANGGAEIPRKTAQIIRRIEDGLPLACIEEINALISKYQSYEKEGYKV